MYFHDGTPVNTVERAELAGAMNEGGSAMVLTLNVLADSWIRSPEANIMYTVHGCL